MTIIKQTGVCSARHQRNLRGYINDDRKVLLRGCQNLDGCTDIKRWASYMESTYKAWGHDKTRKHRDPKTGELVDTKSTVLYHQILGFLADECDINGGKLTPEDCMAYAKEYAQRYYPNQQIVFALHNEYCKADKTHRYAIHMVINRTDLVTHKRLDEGRSKVAKFKRAKRVREMDSKWGLRQVVEGEGNSAIHKKQPSKVEREIEGRGGKSYKTNLRELCRIAARKAESIYEYRELLEGWGVDTEFRNGRMYVTDNDNARYSFSVKKLDADLSQEGLEKAFRSNIISSIQRKGEQFLEARQAEMREQARIQSVKESYLSGIRETYLDYREKARAMEGTALKDFPKLKFKRPPEEIANDPDVKRTILAYWRGGDELRVRMAAEVPYARKAKGGSTGGNAQAKRAPQTPEKDGRTSERQTGR